MQLRVDEEWADRRMWAGGIGRLEATAPAAPAGTGPTGLAHQVSAFLKDQTEPGTS